MGRGGYVVFVLSDICVTHKLHNQRVLKLYGGMTQAKERRTRVPKKSEKTEAGVILNGSL